MVRSAESRSRMVFPREVILSAASTVREESLRSSSVMYERARPGRPALIAVTIELRETSSISNAISRIAPILLSSWERRSMLWAIAANIASSRLPISPKNSAASTTTSLASRTIPPDAPPLLDAENEAMIRSGSAKPSSSSCKRTGMVRPRLR